MISRSSNAVCLFGTAVALVLGTIATANAGGFALREQSALGQGTSYAGIAAGGSLSSMFWNPATMTQVPGVGFEVSASGILPNTENTPLTGSTLFAFGGTGNTIDSVFLPSGYASWQVDDQIWLGLSFNAPFGLSLNFPDRWAGRNYGESSNLRTYDITPTVAFKLNDMISLGAGLQVQDATARIQSGLGATPGAIATLKGSGWAIGFTAGITVTPAPNVEVGLGWRSGISQDVDATLTLPPAPIFSPPFSTPGAVKAAIDLPDVVSLGARLHVSPEWTVLETIEFSHWGRIGTAHVLQPSGAPALIGTAPVDLPFQYKDGWFSSLGVEYQLDPSIALRTGIGFERSPVTDRVRMPLVPDSDRLFLSIGGSTEIAEGLRLDLAYSHIFLQDSRINITAASGNPWFNPVSPIAYVGNVSSHIDIVSLSLAYRWK
jgi:long-chain fatty acid transport protein